MTGNVQKKSVFSDKTIVITFLVIISTLAYIFLYRQNTDVSIKQRLIAHAGGEIYGLKLTNSRQALDLSYKRGFRLIELDFEWTSDGVPVIVHDWGNLSWYLNREKSVDALSFAEYKKEKVKFDIELMDLDNLNEWILRHQDVYVITDIKMIILNFKVYKNKLSEIKNN